MCTKGPRVQLDVHSYPHFLHCSYTYILHTLFTYCSHIVLTCCNHKFWNIWPAIYLQAWVCTHLTAWVGDMWSSLLSLPLCPQHHHLLLNLPISGHVNHSHSEFDWHLMPVEQTNQWRVGVFHMGKRWWSTESTDIYMGGGADMVCQSTGGLPTTQPF